MNTEVRGLSEEEAFSNLANAVIERAVADWRYKCKKNKPDNEFDMLRHFFKSKWARILCDGARPTCILERLEEERELLQKNRRVK